MRQSLISQFLAGTSARPPEAIAEEPVEFYDLFCGMGGASEGARQAGYRVAGAVDASEAALATHALRHPDCRHLCARLPDAPLGLPEDGRAFHLHGSPPCTRISVVGHTARGLAEAAPERARALGLVDWFVALATRVAPRRWSMEQVADRQVLRRLQALRAADRRVDFDVFDFAQLGLPQNRRRVIAGPPELVDRLRRARSSRAAPSIASVLRPPEAARYMKGTKMNARTRHSLADQRIHPSLNSRGIERPAYTVTTSKGLRWLDARFKTIRVLSLPERCVLQGFAANTPFPAHVGRIEGYRLVGNALPPLVVRLLLAPSG
jgi:DNA (cytosine-5)-methyltransferase 1